MTVLRSLLFVPGNQPSMLEKAMGFRPDEFEQAIKTHLAERAEDLG